MSWLVIIAIAGVMLLLLANVLINLAMRGRKPKRSPIALDPKGWRSQVTFKPLPRFADQAMRAHAPYESAMMTELGERLRSAGARIDSVKRVGDSERLTILYEGALWQLTLLRYQAFPEQWVLGVDELLGGVASAPHDVPESRALLTLLKVTLGQMDVSTVRWHARQEWNAGRVDTWSHKPFDR